MVMRPSIAPTVITAVACTLIAGVAQSAPVLMISIDGLRPADVLQARERGLRLPVLEGLVHGGATASGVRNALPTVTYPNHTTLVTGVWPARHGVASNLIFDPLKKDEGGWYWYASDIKVPTLWDVVHAAGRPVASLGWPVTVGSRSIDINIPEYWRAHDARDAPLGRALATPGLPEAIEATGTSFVDTGDTQPNADALKARDAVAIYRLRRPALFTIHLSSLDEVQHATGPGSPESHATLERIDADVGEIVQAARAAESNVVVAIVSDHGFAPVQHEVDLGTAFVEAGLIRLDPTGKPVGWDAAPWASGGSAGVVLARRYDPVLRTRVAELLHRLVGDPNSGVGRVIGREEIAAMGGSGDMDFFIDARQGYSFGSKLTGPLVRPNDERGTHGYFPDHPEMRATLILNGPGVPVGRDLGEVDMRRIAPTLAHELKVALPTATEEPLF